jgi:hypothetical protein
VVGQVEGNKGIALPREMAQKVDAKEPGPTGNQDTLRCHWHVLSDEYTRHLKCPLDNAPKSRYTLSRHNVHLLHRWAATSEMAWLGNEITSPNH